MLRIAICDDEVNARESLYLQLERILHEGEEVVYEFSSGNAAVRWLEKHPGEIDLLFLDVEMADMNGMETAHNIRKFNRELLIVFVTGYADYVFDGYSVGALDYLMKPVDMDKLRHTVKRVRELQLREQEEMYTLRNTEGTYRFRIRDILYFYSDRRQVVLVCSQSGGELREYGFYQKLNQVEEELRLRKERSAEYSFVRIHQRYLVNAVRVEHMDASHVAVGGRELPVSRAMKNEAMQKIARVMLEVSVCVR